MITETIENIDKCNIVIMPSVKNNVIDDGLFHKLLYHYSLIISYVFSCTYFQ